MNYHSKFTWNRWYWFATCHFRRSIAFISDFTTYRFICTWIPPPVRETTHTIYEHMFQSYPLISSYISHFSCRFHSLIFQIQRLLCSHFIPLLCSLSYADNHRFLLLPLFHWMLHFLNTQSHNFPLNFPNSSTYIYIVTNPYFHSS